MGWLNLFYGPPAEKLEQQGDDLSAAGFWGEAKLSFEKAHRKLEAAAEPNRDNLQRVSGKIMHAREALARDHQHHAAQLAGIGDLREALELLDLALELTGEASLKTVLSEQRRTIMASQADRVALPSTDPEPEMDSVREEAAPLSTEEQFMALCGTLPDAVRQAYMGYGPDFITGYVALNQGDFETAEHYLASALDVHPSADSYIPLELATACLNLNQTDRAKQLLESLLIHRPDALPAYEMLCEIYWEQGAFEQAERVLDSIPDHLASSLAVFVLKGETLYQAGRFEMAIRYYQDIMATYGWNEALARALAKTHEASGELDQARHWYQEIMGHCSGCHRRIDPLVKAKYADLSFAAGIHDTAILELYLDVAQEIPENAATYYAKVSHIYRMLGYSTEAERFLMLAEQVAGKPPGDLSTDDVPR